MLRAIFCILLTAGALFPQFDTSSSTGQYPQHASTGGQTSTTNWGSCGTTACAGGAGNSASLAQAVGISSPSISGASMSVSYSSPASGNNALWYWKPGACDTCTWIIFDFYAYVPPGVANYEFDSFIFNKTNGNWDAMFGHQCNTVSGFWQYANQNSSWSNSTIACSLTTGVWHHIVFTDSYIPTDTSCSGAPCERFGSLQIDGTSYSWGGVTLPATTLNATWTANYGCQVQMDSNSTGTLTEYVDNYSCLVGG